MQHFPPATVDERMIGTLALTVCQLPEMADQPTQAVKSLDSESSYALVLRAHDGDLAAQNELCARYLPRLQRWAHGRLPAWARGALDTHDLVQDTFIQVLKRIGEFEPRHEGAFHGYLRQALLNRVRDEIRRAKRHGPPEPLDPAKEGSEPSPLEEAIGHETLERYESALSRLKPGDREAIILRIELNYPYADIATALGKPSIAATQMAVSRALVRLAEEMASGQA
jgi:RNA polymerase sigma factor (sigma-70 family)